MNYFLAKTDPGTYSLADLQKDGLTVWDGVHNYAAIRFIKQMKPGDNVFIYESQTIKSIVGLAEIVSKPFENKDDPRFSWAVRLKFIKRYKDPLTLAEIKADPELKDIKLVREPRLSVMATPTNIAHKFLAKLG